MQMANAGGFGRILVPFDGSKDAEKAVRTAAVLASKFRSSVVVVHVYHSPLMPYAAGSGMPGPDYHELEQAAKEGGSAILARGLKLAEDAGLKAKGELLQSTSVVQAVVEYASDNGFDLIVVGTRGMTGFKKLILGSVSSGLASHSPCPVLVVR